MYYHALPYSSWLFTQESVLLPLSQKQSAQSEADPDHRKKGANDSHRPGEAQTRRLSPSLTPCLILLKRASIGMYPGVYLLLLFTKSTGTSG